MAIPAENDLVTLIALSGVRPRLDRMIEHIISLMHPLLDTVPSLVAVYAEPRLVTGPTRRRFYLGRGLVHLNPAGIVGFRYACALFWVEGKRRTAQEASQDHQNYFFISHETACSLSCSFCPEYSPCSSGLSQGPL